MIRNRVISHKPVYELRFVKKVTRTRIRLFLCYKNSTPVQVRKLHSFHIVKGVLYAERKNTRRPPKSKLTTNCLWTDFMGLIFNPKSSLPETILKNRTKFTIKWNKSDEIISQVNKYIPLREWLNLQGRHPSTNQNNPQLERLSEGTRTM